MIQVAVKNFNSVKDLLAYAQKQVNSTLKNEVAVEAVNTLKEHIVTDVYDVYSPQYYERKGAQGGFLDEDNIEVEVVDDETISVDSIRFDGNRDVAQIVESGQGYMNDFEYNGVPRPFTENTREELRSSNRLQNAMKRGLKKRGLDVQ